jgi:molybdopterin synthase catalytic subunit
MRKVDYNDVRISESNLAVELPIIMVATAAPRRAVAFAAVEFLMDYLKSRAPFWKKETGTDGET